MTSNRASFPATSADAGRGDRAGSGLSGGAGQNRSWPRWWTLPPPVLLTLPAAAWCVLVSALASLCFDTCGSRPPTLNPIGITEFFLGVASVVTLIVGLFVPAWRRVLRWVLWATCVLAWAGGAYLWHWASTTP
jgi:hypothetical protein